MDLKEIGGPAQQRHPWEVARARFFVELVSHHVPPATPLRVLDVGAGDGYLAGVLLSQLPAGSQCLCVDAHYTDAHLRDLPQASQPGVTFARQASADDYDLLLMLDVLEHVEDDLALLTSYAQRLRPGGHLVASVPAFMTLYSQHDVSLGHYRRYRPSELRELVQGASFEIMSSGSLFHSLLPVRVMQKAIERLRGQAAKARQPGFGAADEHGTDLSAWAAGPTLSRLVERALLLDNMLSRTASAVGLPVPGLSAWVWSRKS